MPISQETKVVIAAEVDRLQKIKKSKERELSIISKEKQKIEKHIQNIDSDILKLEGDMK